MKKTFSVTLSKGCSVLLTLWNRQPQEVLQYFVDRVSEQLFVEAIAKESNEKDYSTEQLKRILQRILKSPKGLSTYYFVRNCVLIEKDQE